ncbi:MAG: hypothetical protein ACFFDD_02560 [Promethearchaeota archaeon]
MADLGPATIAVKDNVVADVRILDLLPDPALQDSPDVVMESSSGEFFYYHDGNSVSLAWSHLAGTPLDFRPEAVAGLPDCLDFIYLFQEFEWPYNEVPTEVIYEIKYNTTFTGSFLTETFGQVMFKLYVWLVDSSGEWVQLYESDPPYIDDMLTRSQHLSYFQTFNSFGGMVESEQGIQEDPEDSVAFVVGLAPTIRFEYNEPEGIHPWEVYTGTVIFGIQSLKLTAFLQTENDPSLGIASLFNNTWSKDINSVYPYPPLAGSANDWATDVATGDDGSVYIVGHSSIPYDYYIETGHYFAYQTLLKFDPKTNLIWRRHLENQTYGRGVCVDGGFIYTSGKIRNETGWYNAIIAKYTTSGQLLWKRIWDNGADEIGDSIAVAPDGTIFVCVIYQNIRAYNESDAFLNSVLLKYSPKGELLSNLTLDIPYMEDQSEMRVTNSSLYLWEGHVSCRDHDGNILWSTFNTEYAFTLSTNGTLCTARETFVDDIEYIEYLWWDSQGNITRLSNFSIVYDKTYTERTQCGQIAVAPDGSLIGLLMKTGIDFGYVMVKFSSEGELLWNKTIIDKFWGQWIQGVHLRVASTGLAYEVNWWNMDIHIDAFVIGNYSIPATPVDPTIIVFLGGGIVLAAAALVYWKRRQTV